MASPGYAPETIAVNVTCIEREYNACQTICCMYQSIFNRFPVIQLVCLKVRYFSTFLHILASPGYVPGTLAVNVTWMERGINTGQTHSSMYPTIFNHLRGVARYWSKIATFFLYPLHLTPPLGVIPLDDLRDFWRVTCRVARLQYDSKISPKS